MGGLGLAVRREAGLAHDKKIKFVSRACDFIRTTKPMKRWASRVLSFPNRHEAAVRARGGSRLRVASEIRARPSLQRGPSFPIGRAALPLRDNVSSYSPNPAGKIFETVTSAMETNLPPWKQVS